MAIENVSYRSEKSNEHSDAGLKNGDKQKWLREWEKNLKVNSEIGHQDAFEVQGNPLAVEKSLNFSYAAERHSSEMPELIATNSRIIDHELRGQAGLSASVDVAALYAKHGAANSYLQLPIKLPASKAVASIRSGGVENVIYSTVRRVIPEKVLVNIVRLNGSFEIRLRNYYESSSYATQKFISLCSDICKECGVRLGKVIINGVVFTSGGES